MSHAVTSTHKSVSKYSRTENEIHLPIKHKIYSKS